jgi:CIC family chloride channel protein
VFGGLVVGLIALGVPQVLGVGYDYVSQVLNNEITLRLVLMLAVLKLFAVAACYASGNTGGIFGPSLFMGAMVGGAVGSIAHQLLPNVTATPGAYALVGMGTLFAGIIRTPLTSVFMIFEITRDYSIVVPVMIANLISFVISYRLQRTPVYDALTEQDGIHLPKHAATRTQWRTVAQIMERQPAVVSPDTPVRDLPPHPPSEVYVIEQNGRVLGLLTASEADRAGNPAEAVGSVMQAPKTHLHGDHSLESALERMGRHGVDVLPVMDRADVTRLRGIVSLADIMSAYGVERTPRT